MSKKPRGIFVPHAAKYECERCEYKERSIQHQADLVVCCRKHNSGTRQVGDTAQPRLFQMSDKESGSKEERKMAIVVEGDLHVPSDIAAVALRTD